MEQRVGQRPADPFVEQDDHERGSGAVGGKAVAVGTPDALQQTASFHLAEVVAELRERVRAGGKAEGSEDGLMDIGGPPSIEFRTAMQQHLHQPHPPDVADLDAGDFGFADGDRQSDSLKQREVDMHVQGLGFEAGEPTRNRDQFLT
jgi:hypothetical protein